MRIRCNNQYYDGQAGLFYDIENDSFVLLTNKRLTMRTVKLIPPTVETLYLYDVDFGDVKHEQLLVTEHDILFYVGEFE